MPGKEFEVCGSLDAKDPWEPGFRRRAAKRCSYDRTQLWNWLEAGQVLFFAASMNDTVLCTVESGNALRNHWRSFGRSRPLTNWVNFVGSHPVLQLGSWAHTSQQAMPCHAINRWIMLTVSPRQTSANSPTCFQVAHSGASSRTMTARFSASCSKYLAFHQDYKEKKQQQKKQVSRQKPNFEGWLETYAAASKPV